jgi:hypothetical protein
LLFGRDGNSRKLAKELFVRETDKSPKTMSLPNEFWVSYGADQHLGDFPAFRFHLAYIQERMQQWKPRKFSELFIPGYFDRLSWFTAVFGLVFGVIGALSLVTSILQVGLAIAAWKNPVQPA